MATYLPQIQDTNATTLQNQQQNTNTTGSQRQSTNQTSANQSQGAQANVYNPEQDQLQQLAAKQAAQYLQTGVAPGVDASLAAQSAAFKQNFNQMVAPQMAAQYGAGSPAIASAEAQGLVNLTSDVYKNQGSQFNSALGTAAGMAYTPTGSVDANKANASSTLKSKSDWQQAMDQSLNMAANSNYFGISQI